MDWDKSANILGDLLRDSLVDEVEAPEPQGPTKRDRTICDWCGDPIGARRWWTRWCKTCRMAFVLNAPSPPKPHKDSAARWAAWEAGRRNAAGMVVLGDREPPAEDVCTCLHCYPATGDEETTTWYQADPPVGGSLTRGTWVDLDNEVHVYHHGAWARVDLLLVNPSRVMLDGEITVGRPEDGLRLTSKGVVRAEPHYDTVYAARSTNYASRSAEHPEPNGGYSREHIREVQRDLNVLMRSSGRREDRLLVEDGWLGVLTRMEVKAFQMGEEDLKVDGEPGPLTTRALRQQIISIPPML